MSDGLFALVFVGSLCLAGGIGGHLLARHDIRQGRCWCFMFMRGGPYFCEHERAAMARQNARTAPPGSAGSGGGTNEVGAS